MKKNIRILHIAKKTFLLHSLTSYLGPIFLAIRSIHLQMREANLPVSYLELVFYYPYSLPLLRVNRELENSVSMVMWAWYPGSVFSIRSSASYFSCFRLHPYWRVMSAYTHLFFSYISMPWKLRHSLYRFLNSLSTLTTAFDLWSS